MLVTGLTRTPWLVLCIVLTGLSGQPALAQKKPAPQPTVTTPPQTEEKPTPYDGQLARLAEVLGSIHYLRSLCGAASGDWRSAMQTLLDTETINEPHRREKLTAAFNRGYRAFAAVHTSCTPAARTAEERYRNEGATLSGEIATRYGN
nr:TIGR02301 family protein [Rhizobium rhizoryzae]